MTDRVQSMAAGELSAIDVEALGAWVEEQRWYASKSRHVTGVELAESLLLSEEPVLVLALLQTRFPTGTHELYQLLLGGTSDDQIADALSVPEHARELLRRIEACE